MAEKSKREAKKSFFEVSAPLTSAKIALYASSPTALQGKIVKLDLTRSLRGKNLELSLRVNAEQEQLNSEPVSLELAGSYIRRMMRKGTDYVEDSFITSFKDGKAVIKPFMITRNKVSRTVRRELRNTARQHLEAYATTRTAKEMFADVMANKIQKDLSLKLKKIYPLALCEIRVFRIVEDKK